ncbi:MULTISPECIES: cell division protein FtsL [Ruminococcus]|jgi:cell division protein FtsL|uniref:Cell division protein FtsL n=1 Tax=Ruminococcus flavefaciens TaxID=1265 RepID=A0A1M7J871_RUMFL|nr:MULTISPECIES: cell division protein FtsL [Ruminococcus]MCR4793828.1 cell division protein FtsL [Ruminococcus sp.]SHM49216.1 Cell division protein FtsL [Ruminococcus flavefaciens]
MAENTVRYYNDESYDDADSDETTDMDDAVMKDTEQKPEIHMQKNEAQSGSVLMIIFVSLLAAALLGSVIYSLDKRNTAYNKVSAMNEKLDEAEAENVRLQSELDSKMSAKNIEEYAENVLKMQKIDSTQIKYIKIQTGDVVTIPEQEKGVIAKVKSFFDKCVEYFRG